LGAIDLLAHTAWPPDGLADPHTVNTLFAAGDTVLLSNTALPLDSAPTATPSAHTEFETSAGTVDTILSDFVLSNDVDAGADDPDSSRVALQRFLAETLMIHAEAPSGVARDVVITPDRRWNPAPGYAAQLLADTGRVPWIQPVSLSAVDATPPTVLQRGPLSYPPSAAHNELSASYLHSLAELRNQVAEFSSILPSSGSSATHSFATAVQEALSSAWRAKRGLANDRLNGLKLAVAGQMNQVRIASRKNSYVTLTSHGGKVPVTISNNLDTTVRVTIQVRSQRLSLSGHGRVTVPPIPPHQQTVVEVHAAAKTSGVFPVQVQLLTPSGSKYGPQVQLFVRSTVYGTITLVITGAATAALMIAVAIRLGRRALAARRSATASGA
jgi:Family of unknown function (DUF6049)